MFTVPIGNQALFLIRNLLIRLVTLKPEVSPTTKQANRTSEKYGKESSLSLAEFFNSFLNQGSPLKFKMSVICCQISFKIAFSLGPCFFLRAQNETSAIIVALEFFGKFFSVRTVVSERNSRVSSEQVGTWARSRVRC